MDHDYGKPSRKEQACLLRRAAYQKAKAKRATDPKHIAMKEAMKERRREAARLAKEKRATDPKQIALKAGLKQRRREANNKRGTNNVRPTNRWKNKRSGIGPY